MVRYAYGKSMLCNGFPTIMIRERAWSRSKVGPLVSPPSTFPNKTHNALEQIFISCVFFAMDL